MRFGRNYQVLIGLLLVVALALWGCPKKAEVTSAPETPGTAEQAQGTPDTMTSAEGSRAQETAAQAGESASETAGTAEEGLKPVYFDFDKAYVRSDAADVMRANAVWLKAHPKAKVRIEGNCDERGTAEYNQALGQQRAANAKRYLTDLGVAGGRISLISYGKEKPACTENTESCWQKNRRDDFEVAGE